MIAAVFLIVGLGLLIGYLTVVSRSSQTSSLADLNSARAYQAARTGAEWAIYQITRNPPGGTFLGQCTPAPASLNTPVTPTQRNQNYGGTLAAFTASVNCSGVRVTEGGGTVVAYTITSNACNSGACPDTATTSPFYVERQISLTIVQ
jgi:MSHA biogenesis protein MshP